MLTRNGVERKFSIKDGVKSLKYHYKNLYAWNPKLFYMGIIRVIPDVCIPIFTILMPTVVVACLENKWKVENFICYVGGIMLIMLLLNLINAKIQIIIEEEADNYRFRYLTMVSEKQVDVDYDVLESEEFQNEKGESLDWIMGWGIHGPIGKCISSPGIIIACILGMLGYGIMLGKESGWILIFIIASVLISVHMSTRALESEQNSWKESAKVKRKLRYISNHSMNFSEGKDIRLFGMQTWFMKMYRRFLKEYEAFLSRVQFKYCLESMTDCAMVAVRDAAAYSYLIIKIANGEMSVADFVLYTSLVTGFSTWFRKFIDEIQWLVRGGYAFYAIQTFLEVENHWKGKQEDPNPEQAMKGQGLRIELKDVSFSYITKDNEKKTILSHINLTIEKGEKLALVGLNGAGKTTLVKLLCGFYQPEEGTITVNGRPISDYPREEYYSMISAVFQEAGVLPVSIAENISCQSLEQSKEERIQESIKLAGLEEKIRQLEQGESTLLVRELSSDAIELSGGEKQKLLLARAMYKNFDFLILDEPTAALDPIAENEIYLKYCNLTKGKTSLFISHRLSSTRFCDRIILLDHGMIVEEGSHEYLMEQGGKYAEMFRLQSQYYEEGEKNKKSLEKEGESVYV